MIVNGLIVTVIGMAIVFVFLGLMVIMMQVLSAFVRMFFPQKEEAAVLPAAQGEPEIAAAIAAVAKFYPDVFRRNGLEATGEVAAAITAVKAQQTTRG